MAHLFRPVAVKPVPKSATVGTVDGKPVARWTARGGKAVVAELTAGGTKCRVRSPTWWVEYTDHAGRRQKARGYRSRDATLQLAARLDRKTSAIRAGEDAPADAAGPKHLADFLPAYAEHVRAKCSNEKHRYEAVEYVRQILTGASLTTPASVDTDRLTAWLAEERRRTGPDKKKVWSQQTLNHRVRKLNAFGNWLVKRRKLNFNPFSALELANPQRDRKRIRRSLDHPELLRLFAAARTDPESFAKLCGPDRAFLYLLAAYTGFRISALARLTPESFEWADGVPFRVFGLIQKKGKPHGVPLHPEVGAELAAWLRGRPAGRPLWSAGWKRWSQYGARILRHDLGRARAAFLAEAAADPVELARREASDVLLYRDAAGEVFDFHSLRVQFVSELARSGVSEMAARELAAHSDPKLTSVVYARWGRGGNLAAEVAKMPGLKPAG